MNDNEGNTDMDTTTTDGLEGTRVMGERDGYYDLDDASHMLTLEGRPAYAEGRAHGLDRRAIENELRELYATDDRDATDDARLDALHDQLADLAEATGRCQAIGCRQRTDGWAYCAEHRLPGMSGHDDD